MNDAGQAEKIMKKIFAFVYFKTKAMTGLERLRKVVMVLKCSLVPAERAHVKLGRVIKMTEISGTRDIRNSYIPYIINIHVHIHIYIYNKI